MNFLFFFTVLLNLIYYLCKLYDSSKRREENVVYIVFPHTQLRYRQKNYLSRSTSIVWQRYKRIVIIRKSDIYMIDYLAIVVHLGHLVETSLITYRFTMFLSAANEYVGKNLKDDRIVYIPTCLLTGFHT